MGGVSVKRWKFGKSRRHCSPLKRIFVLVVSTVMLLLVLGVGRQHIFHSVTRRTHTAKDTTKMDLFVDFQSMRMNKDKIYKFHDAGSAYHDTNFTYSTVATVLCILVCQMRGKFYKYYANINYVEKELVFRDFGHLSLLYFWERACEDSVGLCGGR